MSRNVARAVWSSARLMTASLRAAALALPALLAVAGPASGQAAYPDRPVRLVIAFGPGGVADTTSRLVANKLGDKLGYRVIVENNPGGGGIAAARMVLSAQPDGHTLALLTTGTSISVNLFRNLTFNPVTDFAPVSKIGTFEFFMAVTASSPYRSLADVIKSAHDNPGKLNIGSVSPGSTQHLSALLLKSTAGIEFQLVPFRNSGDLLVALLRGDVDVAIDAYAALRGNFDDRKVRPLATSAATRSPLLPGTPTAAESGAGNFDVTAWNGLFVKTGTPAAIVARLNEAMREVLADDDLKRRLLDMGIVADPTSPEELASLLKSDINKWADVIAKNKIEQR
jgi:tripartite-type tricarboxylate transporter receptor subunit TctC